MISIGESALAEISPYFVAFGSSGTVLAMGPFARQASARTASEGMSLTDVIDVVRPQFADIDDMLSHQRQLIIFRFKASGIAMRGQIVPDGEKYLLVSNPWVSTDAEYQELPKELLLYAHHEAWSDYFTISQIFRHQAKELESTVQKLSRSESQLRNIINGVVEAIVIIDMQGIIIQVNPSFVHMFGYAADELVGKNISMIMPEPYKSKHDYYLGQYLATGVGNVIGQGRDVTGLKKDGTSVPLHLSVSVATSFGTKYFVGILEDISSRKRVEKMKDDFIATVSHELKTPLTSVLSSFEFLDELTATDLTGAMRKWVELGNRNAIRLKDLITGILSAEKLSSGTFMIEGEDLEVSELLRKFKDTHLDFVQAISAGIEFLPAPPGATVHADTQAFYLVMINLVRNAVRHARSTRPLQVGVHSADENQVVFVVRDFGIGIPADQQAAIFERFYRVEDVDSRHSSGTGLGLSIAKSVVTRMSGKIWLESEIGQGTSVYFSLPSGSSNTPTG